MSSVASLEYGWLLPLALFSVVQMIVAGLCGLMVGRKTAAGRQGARTGIDPAVAERLVRQLGSLTASVSDDVSKYHAQIKQQADSLESLVERPDQSTLSGIVLNVVREIMRTNQHLQHQLAATEISLERQKELVECYMKSANTDDLTGLPNRRAFNEQLRRMLARFERNGSPLSLILLDLDNFKQLNDNHGHLAGDAVLREVGEIVSECIRDMDFAARIGGEEFAVIMPDTTGFDAFHAAERARVAICEAMFEHAGKRLRVTSSQGVAEAAGADTVDSLTNRADEALYAAKHQGRNGSYLHDEEPPQPSVAAGSEESTSKAFGDSQIEELAHDLRAAVDSLGTSNPPSESANCE